MKWLTLNEKLINGARTLEKIVFRYLPISIILIITITSIFHHVNLPLPTGYSIETLILFDLLILGIILPLIFHSLKKLGKVQGSLFFWTSFLFMVVFENLWILMGRFHILGEAYTFNIGFLWFFDVPVNVGLGWFFFNYLGYYLLKQIFPKITRGYLCILNGLLALSFDIWIDPMVVNSHLTTGSAPFWNWTPSLDPRLFTVPIYNYFGWFLGIAIFTFIYESTWGKEALIQNESKNPIRHYFIKMIIGWLILDVGCKIIPIILNVTFPGMNVFPLDFTQQYQFSNIPVLIIPFGLIGVNVVYYFKRSKKNTNLRSDLPLMVSFWGYLLLNLSMVTILQFAFPGIFLAWLVVVPFNFIFILLILYIRK